MTFCTWYYSGSKSKTPNDVLYHQERHMIVYMGVHWFISPPTSIVLYASNTANTTHVQYRLEKNRIEIRPQRRNNLQASASTQFRIQVNYNLVAWKNMTQRYWRINFAISRKLTEGQNLALRLEYSCAYPSRPMRTWHPLAYEDYPLGSGLCCPKRSLEANSHPQASLFWKAITSMDYWQISGPKYHNDNPAARLRQVLYMRA